MRERERDERVYMNKRERVDVCVGEGGIEERSSAEDQATQKPTIVKD
jgi:hypothetical protein